MALRAHNREKESHSHCTMVIVRYGDSNQCTYKVRVAVPSSPSSPHRPFRRSLRTARASPGCPSARDSGSFGLNSTLLRPPAPDGYDPGPVRVLRWMPVVTGSVPWSVFESEGVTGAPRISDTRGRGRGSSRRLSAPNAANADLRGGMSRDTSDGWCYMGTKVGVAGTLSCNARFSFHLSSPTALAPAPEVLKDSLLFIHSHPTQPHPLPLPLT